MGVKNHQPTPPPPWKQAQRRWAQVRYVLMKLAEEYSGWPLPCKESWENWAQHKGLRKVAFVLGKEHYQLSGSPVCVNGLPWVNPKDVNVLLSWPDQHGRSVYKTQVHIKYKNWTTNTTNLEKGNRFERVSRHIFLSSDQGCSASWWWSIQRPVPGITFLLWFHCI